jgi:hypothetical protein
MSRKKRNSKTISVAEKRLASIRSIDAKLDLGHGVSVRTYGEKVAAASARLEVYNAAIAQADGARNQLVNSERELRDWSERVLAGVAARFGKDSVEYEQAGGRRKSNRKRRAVVKKEKAARAANAVRAAEATLAKAKAMEAALAASAVTPGAIVAANGSSQAETGSAANGAPASNGVAEA